MAVCEELMKIQIAFFEELGMQKIADHCVRIVEDYRKGIGKMCIRDRDAMSLTEIERYRELIQENIGYEYLC